MADREKVIRELENLGAWHTHHYAPFHYEAAETIHDALALLREQEPVKPEREHSGGGVTWWNVCGACRTAINPNDKYCHECGRKVKWNE